MTLLTSHYVLPDLKVLLKPGIIGNADYSLACLRLDRILRGAD